MAREKDPQKTKTIFSTTLRLVLDKGFSGLRMQDVAKEAGLATGTLYIYFKDKEDLINSLFLHLKRENTNEFLKGLDGSQPFMHNFRRIWMQYFYTSISRPERTAFLEQYYRSPYIDKPTSELARNWLEPVYQMLEKGKKELLLKDLPSDILLTQLTGPVHELIRSLPADDFPHKESLAEVMYQMAWDSVKR